MDQVEKIEQNLSDEQWSEFFDILGSLSPGSLGRNDPCLCGSGLKYKKCCLAKIKSPLPSEGRLESFEIKEDALTPEESKNSFLAIAPEDEELMTTLFHNLQEHLDRIDSENCEYFQKLNILRGRYPNNPVILNYIVNGYDHLGLQDQVEKLVVEMYEKFPDYLFAQLAQANLYLTNGLHEKALGVLKGAYTLKQLHPHRTVFHISEFRAFEYFMVRYFCLIGNIEQAKRHLQFMEEVLEEDDVLLQDAQKILEESKTVYSLKIGMARLLGLAKKKQQKK